MSNESRDHGVLALTPDCGERWKIVSISPAVISRWLIEGAPHGFKPTEGLPDDAIMVGSYHNMHTQMFGIIYWSSKFEVVPHGVQLPEFPMVFETICPRESEPAES